MTQIKQHFFNYMNSNTVNEYEQQILLNKLMYDVGIMCTFILINFFLGPWLWNNVLVRLLPMVKKAEWYDTVLLSVLLGLVLNH